MKVSLIRYDADALNLLLFTKQTRLTMDNGLMDEIRAWPREKKEAELRYMLNTIESSWEFVDYVFSLSGVSRAFTHQLVRTRDASYAQQSQRTVNMAEFEFVMPEELSSDADTILQMHLGDTRRDYSRLIQIGVNPQDARSILPTNTATNILVKANLATLSRMAEKRLCTRTQGEYQNIFRLMRLAILEVHPWAEPFLRVYCAKRGVCCFPNYTECPIKPGIFNPDNGLVWPGVYPPLPGAIPQVQFYEKDWEKPLTKSEIQARWEVTRFEAVPKETKR